MGELEEYIAELLAPWCRPCPRCTPLCDWFVDGRCVMCGMDPRDQGPAPIRILRGIAALDG